MIHVNLHNIFLSLNNLLKPIFLKIASPPDFETSVPEKYYYDDSVRKYLDFDQIC